MHSLEDLWAAVMEELRQQLSQVAMDAWFSTVVPVELTADTLYLYCESGFCAMYIQQKLLGLLGQCLERLMVTAPAICFLTEEQYRAKQAPPEETCGMTFSTFVVGESNRLAFWAAEETVERFDRCSNPLVLFGPSGVGKTHLLSAVASRAGQRGATVRFLKGDGFINEVVESIRGGGMAQFREKYRTADFFLVDDVQFIAGKKTTQEEFFNTFEALHRAGCRIVLAMDRPPRELDGLDEKIRGRFEGGLLVEMAEPDYETRRAIVRVKAAERGLVLTEEEIACVATHLPGSVRRLEGVLNRLKARQILTARGELNPEPLAETVRHLAGNLTPSDPAEEILERVCRGFGLSRERLLGRGRGRTESAARQTAAWLLCRKAGISAAEAGRILHRDHSTVAYAIECLERKRKSDGELARRVEELAKGLLSPR